MIAGDVILKHCCAFQRTSRVGEHPFQEPTSITFDFPVSFWRHRRFTRLQEVSPMLSTASHLSSRMTCLDSAWNASNESKSINLKAGDASRDLGFWAIAHNQYRNASERAQKQIPWQRHGKSTSSPRFNYVAGCGDQPASFVQKNTIFSFCMLLIASNTSRSCRAVFKTPFTSYNIEQRLQAIRLCCIQVFSAERHLQSRLRVSLQQVPGFV